MRLVDAVARAYPAAVFFLACGPMSEAYCPQTEWLTAKLNARGVEAHNLDQRQLDARGERRYPCECCRHPGSRAHAAMGADAAAFVAEKLGWQLEG